MAQLRAEACGYIETQFQYKNWGDPETLMIEKMEKTVNEFKHDLLNFEHMKTQVTEKPEMLGLYLIFIDNVNKSETCIRMDEDKKIFDYSTELASANLVKLLNINDVPKEVQVDS